MPDNSDLEQEARGWLTDWLLVVAAVGGLSWLWSRTPKSLADLRKLGINLLIVLPICLIGYTAFQAVTEDMMIVEAIAIPKALEDQGYTSTIVAQRLIDKVEHIHSSARARVDRQQIGQESRFTSLSSLQVPQSGLTVRTFVELLRTVFRSPDDKIGGEITIGQDDRESKQPEYKLALRFDINRNTPERLGRPTDSRHVVKDLKSHDLDDLLNQAAEIVVEKTAPATLATFRYQARDWQGLEKLLDQLVESSKPKIKARAMTLQGTRLAEQCRFDEALPRLQEAIKTAPNPRFAMIKYGEALTRAGRLNEAIAVFEQVGKKQAGASTSVLLYGSWAKALALSGRLNDAEAMLEQADRLTVEAQGGRDPRLHRIWGDILRHAERHEGAKKAYRTAVALDPQDWMALERWGLILFEQQDVTAAIEKFQRAIKQNERAHEPHYRLGWALLTQGDVGGAISAFQEAAKVANPEQAKAWLKMAQDLAGVPDRAVMLQTVKALAPGPEGCLPSARLTTVPSPEPAKDPVPL